MCVLVVLLAGCAEAQRPIAKEMLSLTVLASVMRTTGAWTKVDGCKPFKEIYTGGEDLIERMWGKAFKYELDEARAYTMWWFEGGTSGAADPHSNPNDLITRTLGKTVPNQCHLDYFHKDAPTAEGANFTECHPWHASSCCHEATVVTPTKLNEGYGAGYEWDRCGPMSQACERFFVQEACFYECEVNAGLYRRFTDEQHFACSAKGVADGATVTLPSGASYTCTKSAFGGNEENKWELYRMPIKASFADAWYRACSNDLFCGSGNFFACAGNYHEQLKADVEAAKRAIPVYGIVLLIVTGVLALLCCVSVTYIIRKEKKGEPLFISVGDPKRNSSTGKASGETHGTENAQA